MCKNSEISILSRMGPLQKRDENHTGVNVYAVLDQDRIISSGNDYCIRLWNWDTGVEEMLLAAESHHAIECMAISHDKTKLATGHGSWGGVHVWDLESGKLISSFTDEMYISSVAFSEDDSKVYMHHDYNRVVMLDASTCEVDHVVNKDGGSSSLSAFSLDGSILYYFDTKYVYAMESTTGNEVWQATIAGDRCFVLSPNGERLALLDKGRNIQILRCKDGAIGPVLNTDYDFMGPYDDIALTFSADSEYILIACGKSCIQLWHIESGDLCCQTSIQEETSFTDIIVLPNNKHFVFGDWHGNNYLGELKISSSNIESEIKWNVLEPDAFTLLRRQYMFSKSGYYWESPEFIRKLAEMDENELHSNAILLMKPEASSNALTVGLLVETKNRIQELDTRNSLIADILISILQQSTRSAGAALHDSHGMMDTFATDSATAISQLDRSQLSKDQWNNLLQVYEQVSMYGEELDQIGISFEALSDFVSGYLKNTK